MRGLFCFALCACFSDAAPPEDVVAPQLVPGATHVGVLLPLSTGDGVGPREVLALVAPLLSPPGGRPLAFVVLDSRPDRLVGRSGVDAAVAARLDLLERHGVVAVIAGDARTAALASARPLAALAAAPAAATSGLLRLGPDPAELGAAVGAAAAAMGAATLGVAARGAGPGTFGAAAAAAFAASGGRVLSPLILSDTTDPIPARAFDPWRATPPEAAVLDLDLPDAVALVAVVGRGPRYLLRPEAASDAFLDALPDLTPLAGALAAVPAPGPGAQAFERLVASALARAPGPLDGSMFDGAALVALAAAAATALAGPLAPPVAEEVREALPAVMSPPGEALDADGLARALALAAAGDEVAWLSAAAGPAIPPSVRLFDLGVGAFGPAF